MTCMGLAEVLDSLKYEGASLTEAIEAYAAAYLDLCTGSREEVRKYFPRLRGAAVLGYTLLAQDFSGE